MSIWIAAILSLACLLRESTCFTLVAEPSYQQIPISSNSNKEYTFQCRARDGTTLSGCHVKNLTANSNQDALDLGSRWFNGLGLHQGLCGFKAVHHGGVDAVLQYGCRAHSNGTPLQWEYATAVVHVVDSNLVGGVLKVGKTPPGKIEVQAGSEVNLNFTANQPLWKCEVKWSGQTTWVSEGFSNDYEFDNSGLHQGRCGIRLRDIQGEQSGIFTTRLLSTNNSYGKHREFIHTTTLVVILAPRPSAPALSLNRGNGVYLESYRMQAWCYVGLARPVPRVTWLLNDVIQDYSEGSTRDPWDYEAAKVKRRLDRRLSLADDGKELMCRVQHVSLPGGGVDVKTKLRVLLSSDCGVRAGDATPVFDGGNMTRVDEFPWQVSVFRHKKERASNGWYTCSGTLVSIKHIVTAANCFVRGNMSARHPQDYTVFAGKPTAPMEIRDQHEQMRAIKKIHVHENYQSYKKNLEADIAVLELERPFEVTEAVNVACMDWSNGFDDLQLADGSVGTVPGWFRGMQLRYVDLPFVSNAECWANVHWDFKKDLLEDKFCGGYTEKSIYKCPGNEGAGFVFPIATTSGVRYFLRGVASSSQGGFDVPCHYEDVIVFTKVSTYMDWVKKIVFAK